MAVPKISSLLIALIWVSFFAAIFGIFIANMTTGYNVQYNTSQVELFNKLNTLNTETASYKNSSLSFKENTGVFDVIGGYFSNGYKTMKITLSSLDIFNKMTNTALQTPGMNIPGMQYLNTAIILTVLVMIIIGVMLSAILKKDV
jgi:vacuolar-type H+-ATPase subunit I/STV1